MVTPRSTDDLALVGLLLAGDHAEQRGLAGAVGADEADLLALQERGRGLDEEDLVAVLLADVVETNHDHRGVCGNSLAALSRFALLERNVPPLCHGRGVAPA